MAGTETKSEARRPLPDTSELDTQAFWQGTRQHEFRYQQCANCGTIAWHPRRVCNGCTDSQLEWHVSKGEGEIYSFSVVRQSYHPFFRNMVPYAVAWVDLDEGPRFLTNVVGVEDPSVDIRVGQRVKVDWEDHDGLAIPLVSPIIV